jgi:hypothetical protein
MFALFGVGDFRHLSSVCARKTPKKKQMALNLSASTNIPENAKHKKQSTGKFLWV